LSGSAQDEVPSDDERKTMKVVDSQIVDKAKTEIQRCDLYDVRVTFENVGSEEAPQWVERHALTLPNTGILGKYAEFLKDPEPFFV
jgi:hypothetical protein